MKHFNSTTALLSLLLAGLASSQSSSSDSSSLSSSTKATSSSSSSSAAATNDFTFSSGLSASTITTGNPSVPSGPYQTYTSQRVAPSSSSSHNATSSSTTNTLLIVGSAASSSSNTTARSTTSTSSSAPQNTQPCNNYPEFCTRRYMNTTEVCAHNSAFSIPDNAASNQAISITGQLDDGVRMIQGETHYVNGTIYSCHTSCQLLNAGPLADELATVADWVKRHPYDVVTILLVNSDFRPVGDYVAPIQQSGLAPYLYTPPKIPMYADDWPTLGELILTGSRVVVFMDYQANQTEVPYILDEFSQMWETPFSPTDPAFPCTQQRPPHLSKEDANRLPYLANHNLNIEVALMGSSILIPQFAALNQTNSVNGTAGMNSTGSLGAMATECAMDWKRAPAWLLVDFYNLGNVPGSVFEVAARMNNVTYNRPCCGVGVSLGAVVKAPGWAKLMGAVVAVVGLGLGVS